MTKYYNNFKLLIFLKLVSYKRIHKKLKNLVDSNKGRIFAIELKTKL